jgi:hypothetical protein
MSSGTKRVWCWCGAAFMFLVALYSFMGILQAGSIHEGERALRNLRLWGPIMASGLLASAFFVFFAVRLGRSDRRK